MIKKLYYFYIILWVLSSCHSNNPTKILDQFSFIDPETILNNTQRMDTDHDSIIIITPQNFDRSRGLFFSHFMDTVWGVRLETSAKSLIGTIDKIKLEENVFYILDKYNTKTLKCFDIQGNYLQTVGQVGGGPGEYIEPTDFYIDKNQIIIYDQFHSKLLFYNKNGEFVKEKTLPFIFSHFNKIQENSYLMEAVDADNYHLEELLGYSLWVCDSSFVINKKGRYREKDKFTRYNSQTSLQSSKENLFYKPLYNDTIFHIHTNGNISSKYVIDFKDKKAPERLLLQENRRLLQEEFHERSSYAFGYTYIITPNYLYHTYSIQRNLYSLIHSFKDNITLTAFHIINDINEIFPFQRILTSQDNLLIGYMDGNSLYEQYNYHTDEEWRNLKGIKQQDRSKTGEQVIEFCRDIQIEDNPILIFYQLKENINIPTYVNIYTEE